MTAPWGIRGKLTLSIQPDAVAACLSHARRGAAKIGRLGLLELYTVVINTYQRPALLEDAIRHWSECPRVESIRVVHSSSDPTLSNGAPDDTPGPPPVYHRVFSDSLNNRFRPDGFRTEATLHVDDDVRVACADVEAAFELWRSGARHTIVGWFARVGAASPRRGGAWYGFGPAIRWSRRLNIVLTKAAFVHVEHLVAYSSSRLRGLRDFVDAVRNCEDIAMAFTIANQTGRPPLLVTGRVRDLGSFRGLSTGIGHMSVRPRCVHHFATTVFGRNPLVDSAPRTWMPLCTWQEYFAPVRWLRHRPALPLIRGRAP